MNKAQEVLRRYGVEIDLSDHRSPEEIVHFLGLSAAMGDALASEDAQLTTQEVVQVEDTQRSRWHSTYHAH